MKLHTNIVTKIVVVSFGSFLMSLGITLYLKANLGVDPLSVFISGLANFSHLTYGLTSQLWMLLVMVIIYFLDKKRLGIGTVLNALLIGIFVDFLLGIDMQVNSLQIQILLLVLGSMIMAIGIGTYISGGLGEGAMEALMIIVHKRSKIELKWVKIAMDIVLFLIGALLGGSIGIGTLIGVLVTGPVVEKTVTLLNGLTFAEK